MSEPIFITLSIVNYQEGQEGQDLYIKQSLMIQVKRIYAICSYSEGRPDGTHSSVQVEHTTGVVNFNCLETVEEINEILNKV